MSADLVSISPNDIRSVRFGQRQPSGFTTNKDLHDLTANDLLLLARAIGNLQGQIIGVETTVTKTVGEKITFAYDDLAVSTFLIGETVTDTDSSATGVVVSSSGGVLVLSTLTGLFYDNDDLLGGTSGATAKVNGDPTSADGATTLTYDNLAVDIFEFGETVTDNVTGATGVVVSSNSIDTLILKDVTGSFNDNDDIVGGTSGATADMDGNATYTTIDLTNAVGANVFLLSSSNTNLAIGNFTNAPVVPFRVIAGGSTVYEIINGIIKTDGSTNIILKGSTGDFANFETRSGVIKEINSVIYT